MNFNLNIDVKERNENGNDFRLKQKSNESLISFHLDTFILA